MRRMKKKVTISDTIPREPSSEYWMDKTPGERLEAVEIIRSQYYIMLGYTGAPPIKRTIRISPGRN